MSVYKGILLAGGSGSRLYPLTSSISKQLLPIYNKPMIYYSLSVLMLAGIRDILIISTPQDLPKIKDHFGCGKRLGIQLSYAVQEKPKGIAEAFIIGEAFIKNHPSALVLGDNIFYGNSFTSLLKSATEITSGATLFAYKVKDPERFGVVSFDIDNIATSIEEKPTNPKSNYAVTGLYFYDENVVDITKSISPSNRGELEITDVNKVYLSQKNCRVTVLGRGFSWMDTGTYESLFNASEFVRNIENRQNYKVACLEEIAFNNKWITELDLEKELDHVPNQYAEYLKEIIT